MILSIESNTTLTIGILSANNVLNEKNDLDFIIPRFGKEPPAYGMMHIRINGTDFRFTKDLPPNLLTARGEDEQFDNWTNQ